MGLFDWVSVPCPKCGQMVEFQSKADELDAIEAFFRLDDRLQDWLFDPVPSKFPLLDQVTN